MTDIELTGFYNFLNYQMIKYPNIFSNIISVLEHMLFVNGNGYKYYGTLNDDEYNEVLKSDRNLATVLKYKIIDIDISIDSNDFDEVKQIAIQKLKRNINELKLVQIRNFTTKDFSVENFLSIFKDHSVFYSFYPLCQYAIAEKFDKNTEKCLIEITINLITAYLLYADNYENKDEVLDLAFEINEYRVLLAKLNTFL